MELEMRIEFVSKLGEAEAKTRLLKRDLLMF